MQLARYDFVSFTYQKTGAQTSTVLVCFSILVVLQNVPNRAKNA